MALWQRHIKTMPAPSPVVILIDLFFILLIIFMISSNFVFLPGVKSVSLPVSENVEIEAANKLIVTISQGATARQDGAPVYLYSFNGQSKNDRDALEAAISTALEAAGPSRIGKSQAGHGAKLVLRAEKDIPYQEIMHFYSFARKHHVQLFLVTDFARKNDMMRMPPQVQ